MISNKNDYVEIIAPILASARCYVNMLLETVINEIITLKMKSINPPF